MLTDLELMNDGTKADRSPRRRLKMAPPSESDLAPSHVTLVFNILDELRDAPQ